MEVPLVHSNLCRLCAADNDQGSSLFETDDDDINLSVLINTYLPLKVADDGKYSKTVCPGCAIQLEATAEFFNLIINGQKVLREILQKQKQINENKLSIENGLYSEEHGISLLMAGLDKPKRKRGRPKKVIKTEEENETVELEEIDIPTKKDELLVEFVGKRKRKTPERFKEAVQGKELERIFREEGVIDGEESDGENKKGLSAEASLPEPVVEEVIGHLQTDDGSVAGEPIKFTKGKGRGRPKGPTRSNKQRCAICSMEFTCLGRYMSHVAQHGPVIYQCAACNETFETRLLFNEHQEQTNHEGQRVIKCEEMKVDDKPTTEAVPSDTQELTLTIQQSEADPLDQTTENNTFIISMCDFTDNVSQIADNQEETAIENVDVFIEKTQPVVEDEVEVENTKDSAQPTDSTGNDNIEVKKFKCPHCDKTFNSKQSKSVHIKAIHVGARPHKCTECDASFGYARSLALHAVTHRKLPQHQGYACDLCGKVLNHPSSVVYHKEAEHTGKKFKCIKCGKLFKHKQLLQRHQMVHSHIRPYSCKLCAASFKTKANLVNHQMLHSGIKKYSCELCGQTFAHKTSLTLHIRWHSGQKPFECDTCGKKFSQRGNLHEHMRTHTGEKPFSCTICPRRFTTSSQFRIHQRRHTGEKPFACTHCGKRFVSCEALRTHMRRELGQLVHWCNECGRGFAERWAMLKHQRCHTGEKPFSCPHCPRTFADCSNLTKHKKIHKINSQRTQEKSAPPSNTVAKLAPPVEVEEQFEEEEANVIYVEYSVDGDSDATTRLLTLDPNQLAGLEGSKMLTVTSDMFDRSSLLVNDEQISMEQIEDIANENMQEDMLEQLEPMENNIYVEDEGVDEGYMMQHQNMSVTDEDGNPIQLTMITSVDGKSYQVMTQDGQSIPVEIDDEYKSQHDMESGISLECIEVEEQEVEGNTAPARAGVQMLTFDDSALAQLLNMS